MARRTLMNSAGYKEHDHGDNDGVDGGDGGDMLSMRI